MTLKPTLVLKLLAAALVATVMVLVVLAISYATIGMVGLREVFPAGGIFHLFMLLGFFGFLPVLASVVGIGVPAFMLLREKRGGKRAFLVGATVVGAVLSFGIWSHVWASVSHGSVMIAPGAISGLVGGLAIWRIAGTLSRPGSEDATLS